MGQPFPSAERIGESGRAAPHSNPAALLAGIWLCGVCWAGAAWLRRWRQVRTEVSGATPITLNLPVPAMLSRGNVEPGIVGIRRPVLLLPEGIIERLTAEQFEAVITHEMCHVRRRDNLTAALHMVVETLFWFHPLVYWIRRHPIEERERACDEAVLRGGSAPETYAEGILNVCRLYVEAPVACAAGVTGADLKKRIEEIMTRRIVKDLNLAGKLLLGAAGLVVIAAPVAIGIVHAQGGSEARFEVASVKRNPSVDTRFSRFQMLPGGRLSIENAPLYSIITAAYGVSIQSTRISGGAEWIHSERYDIEATAQKGAVPVNLAVKERERRMDAMLRTLLADRFKLVVRRESKDLPVYAVTVAKGGLKMEHADCEPDVSCNAFMGGQGRGVHSKAADMEHLIAYVENWSDRPIVDHSGLTGTYKMDTDGWIPMRGPGGGSEGLDDPVRPTLFTVFEKQLGLKLESQKAVIETYFIEHVERPTGN